MPPLDYLILAAAERVLDGDNDRGADGGDAYSEADLRPLAESINDHGLAHRPVALELPDGFFRLICGHRRKHAMVDILHWDSIPLEVRFLTAAQASDMMLAENASRSDLNPIDEGLAFAKRLKQGQTEEHVAQVAGKSIDYLRRRIRLLNLSTDLRHLVAVKQLPIGIGECLADLSSGRQLAAFRVYERAGGKMIQAEMRALCNDMLVSQEQTSLFGDEDEQMLLSFTPNPDGFRRSGRGVRTTAPFSRDLPPVIWRSGFNVGDALENYMQALASAGLVTAAAALGNVYRSLLAHNYTSLASTPVYPAAADTAPVTSELHEVS